MFNFRLLLLLQILTLVKSQFLLPNVRTLHSSILVDKKLYIFSGFKDFPLNVTVEDTYNLKPDDRFFYLDVSKSFDTSFLPWTAIPDNNKNLPLNLFTPVFSGGVAASYGGKNNDIIYFINNKFDKTLPPVLTFDTSDNLWDSLFQQTISSEIPIGRNQLRPITDNSGKIYLLAGFSFITLQNVTRNGGMFIFDTINSNCTLKYANDAMLRVEYSATLLPNGIIVYMGGKEFDSGKPITDGFRVVYLYNTTDNTWKPQPTFGDSTPNGDIGISSVLGLDGFRIIVFGGQSTDNKMLYVLDTTNFIWYEPNFSGKIPTIKRFDHTANVIGKYMVIAFGSGPNLNFRYKENGENDVLLLDISDPLNYSWTTSFDPPQSSPSQPSPPQPSYNNKNNTRIIIGVVVGVLGIICITSLSILFFIKRRKKLLNETVLPIPGNDENVKSDLELSSRTSGSSH